MSLRVNGNSENKDSIKLNKVMTNPFINTVFDGKLISAGKNGKVSLKEQLYMNTANLPDGLREKFLEYLENRTVKREFIDLLNERYEKKQAEFEAAWAEYQASKDNLKLLEKIYNTLENKYAHSDSNFELSRLESAKKAFTNGEMNTDNLLSKASYIAHRVV